MKQSNTVAYRCPECGSAVLSLISIYALNGERIVLKCPCAKSQLIMEKKGDEVEITAPCMLCPRPHRFTLDKDTFEEEELTTLPCPVTGTDIVFIGPKDDVTASCEQAVGDLLEALNGAGISVSSLEELVDSREDEDEPEEADSLMSTMVSSVLGELVEDEKVYCDCTDNGGKGNFNVLFRGDYCEINCKICGKRRRIQCDNSIATQTFLEASELHLT